MVNTGLAGATSFHSTAYGPEKAFQNLNGNYFYRSKRGLPQSVWMKFVEPHRISQLGFSSKQPYGNLYAPRSFDIVGSSNCAAPWTVLLHVAEAGFPNDSNGNVFKTWVVPPQNRKAFRCIGLKVETIWFMNNPYLQLKNIQMWEEL